ncbi:MAG: hypothetical protein B6I24_11610 [Bacteroidetes bacterium 4572_128]|nr:MAG: hypothetical protein B6I24_11610 [Bacteroidetes bacterium 4572_128]
MKEKVIYLFSFFLIISLFFSFTFSCDSDTKNKILLPGITGKIGELVIVIKKDNWKSKAGNKIRDIFAKKYEYLAQNEPLFDLINIPHNAFSRIFKTHRNIIITQISSSIKKSSISIKKDVFATPQVFISVTAKDEKDFLDILEKSKTKIVNYLLQEENNRISKTYKKLENKNINSFLEKKHNISMVIPKSYTLDMDSSGFSWTALNSYMTIEKKFFPIFFQKFRKKERFFTRIRGLWKTNGKDKMGGPFVSLTTLDKKRNKIITIEAYVYKPNKSKRDLLRQLEAILGTCKVLE